MAILDWLSLALVKGQLAYLRTGQFHSELERAGPSTSWRDPGAGGPRRPADAGLLYVNAG